MSNAGQTIPLEFIHLHPGLTVFGSAQSDPTVPEGVRAVITASIDLLVASRAAEESYPELDDLCRYIQWTIDRANFEVNSVAYIEEVIAQNDASVTLAREEFRLKTARRQEEILWDWCPFWHVLSMAKAIICGLPPLPWVHDSEFPSCRFCLLSSHFRATDRTVRGLY